MDLRITDWRQAPSFTKSTLLAYSWPHTGSLRSDKHRRAAARIIQQGRTVSFDNDHGWMLIGDAAQSSFINKVATIQSVAVSDCRVAVALPTTDFYTLIDQTHIPPDVTAKLPADKLRHRIAGLACLQAPVTDESIYEHSLPASVVSYDDIGQAWIENYDPFGKDCLEALLQEVRSLGVMYPAVTEFRDQTLPVINREALGRMLSSVCDIDYVLLDPARKRRGAGSLATLTLTRGGLLLSNSEFLPAALYSALLPEVTVEKSRLASTSPNAVDVSDLSFSQGPAELRMAVLQHLGWSKQPAKAAPPEGPFITRY